MAMKLSHLKSLREFVDALRALGELVEVREQVDWNLEIGAITRRCYETGAPAPLFSKINGIGHGFRVLGAMGGVSRRPGQYLARVALALGLPPGATGREIVDALVAARERSPLPPRIVDAGPCKENKWLGGQVDLTKLPTPVLHDGDGGRFINTVGSFVARTPDGKWTNWSIARAMIVGPTKMAGIVAPLQHIGMIWSMWKDQGKPMPFALALGGEPFLPYVSGMPLAVWEDEGAYVGGYFGEPIDVVRCETVPLEVPATSEIVIEGFLSNTETALEGPMGEYAGYITRGEGTPKPVYNVTAMTFRNDAILPISVAGEPVEENHTAWGIPNAAEIVYELRKAGLPVASAWAPFETTNNWFVIAMQRDWRRRTQLSNDRLCRRIGELLFASKAGSGTPKYLVVNDDIDITNIREVVWAFATRNPPGERGETIFKQADNQPLVPYFQPGEKAVMRGTKVIYSCLPPDEWGNTIPMSRASFAHNFPKAVQERVLRRWTQLGFEEGGPVEGALGRPQ
jgi:4-hydroxy-3-polyprenylbenzoate decarboxylase